MNTAKLNADFLIRNTWDNKIEEKKDVLPEIGRNTYCINCKTYSMYPSKSATYRLCDKHR